MSTYINPFTDFGFKKIFGEEASKPLLIDFLNALLPEIQIADLSFKDKEQQPEGDGQRRAVYDLYCQTALGERLVVELQRSNQDYFKDRMVYYSTFPIQEQALQGNWNYKLEPIYCIGILNFLFDKKAVSDDGQEKKVVDRVQLKNNKNEVFYDKLMFVYLEMPNFTKEQHELKTRLDQWLYFIKNLENLDSIPEIFKDSIFVSAFEKAKIANYTAAERAAYQESLKILLDNHATFEYAKNTAFEEGEASGLEKGREEGMEKGQALANYKTIQKLQTKGKSFEDISDLLDLSEEEIQRIISLNK